MDLFSQITSLIKVIIWPVTVLIIIPLFKNNINKLLLRVRTAKYKDFSIDFSESLSETQLLVYQSLDENRLKHLDIQQFNIPEMKYLVELSPRILISESWAKLENEIMKQLKKRDISKEDYRKYLNSESLADSYIIKYSDIPIFDNLRNIRNKTVDEKESSIDKDQALEFAIIVEKFINIMKMENDEITD